MTLFLYEFTPAQSDRPAVDAVLKTLDTEIHRHGGELIEAQVTASADRVFAVAEFPASPPRWTPRCWTSATSRDLTRCDWGWARSWQS